MMDSKSSPNWFIDQLTLYQAANSSNEAIKQNFLIRIAEFELIIDDLRSKKTNDPLQHELILGRRGSGKSTLLKRIQIEIEENADLSEKYVAINLAEEQAAIYRLSDLWFEILQELTLKFDGKKKLKDFDSFDENQDYTRYLYGEIHELLSTGTPTERGSQKKAVLLLDNLDRILESFDDDGHLLRETLLNYNDLQIIGGSTRMDEHFWQYDKPFYEFFRRHRLEGLSFEEIRLLLNHWSDAMQLPVLKDFALRNRGKIEAIRIFTDGLPRALQFFIQILLHDSTLYGFDYLRKVMDKASPLYQERLNNLTPPQRKIVLEMAFWWQAVPTKVLVEKCRMEGKLISSYLKQLERFGIVETLNTGNKNHLYRISERFFNMWLIVTQGNPEQKRHAKYLTLFLEMWYDEKELREKALSHIKRLQTGEMTYDKAWVLSKAFSQSKYIGVMERDTLIDYTLKLDDKSILNVELPRKSYDIFKEVLALDEKQSYKEAFEKIQTIENEEDGFKFYMMADCCRKMGRFEDAEKYYLRSVKKGKKSELVVKAMYDELSRVEEEAVEYFHPINPMICYFALYDLALFSENQGKIKQAEEYYLLAIEQGYHRAVNNLAHLYLNQNKNKKQAVELIYQGYEKDKDLIMLKNKVIIEIWNGIFEKIDEKIEQVLKEGAYEDLSWFLTNLLYHEQKQLVLSLFESEIHGKALKSRYELLYFATLILAQKTEGNLLLKIPPEVLPTVEEIVADVKAKQAFYAQSV